MFTFGKVGSKSGLIFVLAKDGVWDITSEKTGAHSVRFGITTQKKEDCSFYSFFIGPLAIMLNVPKKVLDKEEKK